MKGFTVAERQAILNEIREKHRKEFESQDFILKERIAIVRIFKAKFARSLKHKELDFIFSKIFKD